ncbi:MAG TPA: YjjG family noncanonical pyrimidine nucleotidase [Spirochaetia bacterium]|nr:YjjG family noncanonical pyrimidine nucleotidase [Spirochaetales bacterium]HRY79231.1 YjjG family noncanonical pyrimidine nucleotidase [Spirochaetia bacterium]HRZ88582.1 YjjG family noncanonical pyrimidine nucleotidase [Spirochaetia bacterium]
MPRRYDTVFIDADDTLFDYPRAEERAFSRTCVRFGLSDTPELRAAYRRINREQWKLLERGGTDQATLRVERFRLLFEETGDRLDPAAVGGAYVEELSQGADLLPGAREICGYLAERYLLAIVTNGLADVQRSRLALSGLGDLVAALVISEEAGTSKPDPRIFEYACGRVGRTDRGRMLMVGDSLESDIRGGTAFGIDTCWYNPRGMENPTELRPTYEIRYLAELRSIL